jgi:hypothetical protein
MSISTWLTSCTTYRLTRRRGAMLSRPSSTWVQPAKLARPRKHATQPLILEWLEDRTLLSSPTSGLGTLPSLPGTSPVNNLVSSLISNPLSGVVNPLLGSIVNPLLGSVVNPLLGSVVNGLVGSLVNPLFGPLLNPLINSVINSQPSPGSSGPGAGTAAVTTPAASLPIFVARNFSQPSSNPSGSFAPSGASGTGAPVFIPAPPSYSSAQSSQSFYSGGSQERTGSGYFDNDSTRSGSSGADAIETAGLDGDDLNAVVLSDMVPKFDDDLPIENFAATLLTGVQPRASLLPQKGAQVAPVATLLSDDASEIQSGVPADQDARLQDFLINPAHRYPVDSTGPSVPVPDQTSVPKKEKSPPASNHRISSHERDAAPSKLIAGLTFALGLSLYLALAFLGRNDEEMNGRP